LHRYANLNHHSTITSPSLGDHRIIPNISAKNYVMVISNDRASDDTPAYSLGDKQSANPKAAPI